MMLRSTTDGGPVVRHPHLGVIRRIPLPAVGGLNEALAIRATLIFGTMWMFYAFVIYGALGAIFRDQQAQLLYWSNWIQLWSLPLLMVGTNLLGRAGELRARETHDAVLQELKLLKQQQRELRELLAKQQPGSSVRPAPRS